MKENNYQLKCLKKIIIMLLICFTSILLFSNNAMATTDNEVIYLSDIAYKAANTGWGTINFDKTSDNSAITLTLNGAATTFDKGIWAHATSTVEYDLRDYKDYAYFITYYGVNTSSGNKGNGVKFYIYTSIDGEEWNLRTEEEPVAMKSGDNAKYVKIDIKDANYLKLYAYDNGANGQDHSVWADAKIVKETYNDNVTMSVSEYDEIIKEKYKGGKVTEDIELLLLQRDLVNHIGQYQLRKFVEASEQNKEMFDWFFNDVKALRLWTVGGRPDGSYTNALNVLSRLYNTYKEDLQNNETTALGTVYSDLYLRMMLSLSLTHSASVGLWAGGGQYSDAVTRYQIYKDLYAAGKLYSNKLFENLTVEEMRWIMNNIIDDEEIKWLNDHVRKTKAEKPNKNAMDGYTYIEYTFDYSYGKDIYYSQENYASWNEKYSLSDYNITYQKGKPKLWIVFEEGGVCGAISKTTSNIWGSYGVPSTVVSQPKHAAITYYYLDGAGRGAWQLSNSAYPTGWARTGRAEKLNNRMPNGWGNSGATWTNTLQPASYIFLAQEAQNEYNKYEQAELIMLLKDVYKYDQVKLEQVYEDTLKEEIINYDAWIGLVDLYLNDSTKTEEDYLELTRRIEDALKFHPLPMYDLLKRISPKITSAAGKAQLLMEREEALKAATKATSAQSAQAKEIAVVANVILGETDADIAKFSFDGEKAGKIILSSMLQSAEVHWDYSLDGGNTWTDTGDAEHQLTTEEIARINENDNIKVHIVGVDYSEQNIFTINITKATVPSNVTVNDLENFITNTTDKMEWTLDLDGEWQSFSEKPFFDGEETVYVRVKANGTQVTSDYKTLKFTANQDEKYKYIPNKYLTVTGVTQHGGGNKDNIIDGNKSTYWYSAPNLFGSYRPAEITIKLDEARYISRVDYTPGQSGYKGQSGWGQPNASTVEIYISMDGQNFEKIKTASGLANNTSTKEIKLENEEIKKALYVKVRFAAIPSCLEPFVSVSELQFYEDTTQLEYPTADIRYSTTSVTNKDVEAKLINISRHITVTNNDGKETYTFTENGEFTFEFVDDDGNQGSATAVVDWIDKTAPVGTVVYSTTEMTNDDVVASISFDKEVTILNEGVEIITNVDGSHTLTFSENDSLELEFADSLGNIGTLLIEVNWIDKVAPTAEVEFSTIDLTDKPVVATLKPSEEVTIINNDGKDTYTFERNGEFTFEFEDLAGNRGTKTVNVSWINRVPEINVSYDITEPTTQHVTATVTIEDGYRIMNNGGSNVYTFTDSGSFDFEYMDEYGNVGRYTVTVDWIDITPPTAEIEYSTKSETTESVVAKLVNASEKITITNNSGKDTYTFTENGEFTFEFEDDLGNKGTAVAVVDWIITPEEQYAKIKAEAIKIIEDYQAKATEEELNDKEANKEEKNAVIESYNKLRDEDKTPYTEFINRIISGGDNKASINSTKYVISEEFISKIEPNTTVREFKNNVVCNREIVIKDKDGNTLGEDDCVGTGMTLTADTLEFNLVVIGDVNGDGKISTTDIAKLKLHYIEKEELTGINLMAADINGDGKISISDLAGIKLMFIGVK